MIKSVCFIRKMYLSKSFLNKIDKILPIKKIPGLYGFLGEYFRKNINFTDSENRRKDSRKRGNYTKYI